MIKNLSNGARCVARFTLVLTMFLFSLVLPVSAPAGSADSTIPLPEIGVTAVIPDGWTAVTPDTVAKYFSFFEEETPEIAAEVMRSEGVYLVAFSNNGAALRLIVEEGAGDIALYHDIGRYTPQMRTRIKNDFLDHAAWELTGYRFTEAEWTNREGQGRMLNLTYNLRYGGEIIARGRRAYTIRAGKAFSLDLQAKGRQVTPEEVRAFTTFVSRTKLPESMVVPLLPAGLVITSLIPEETYKPDVVIRGESTAGAVIEACFVDGEGNIIEAGGAEAEKSGKFALEIRVPGEGEYSLFLVASLPGYLDSEYNCWIDYNRKRLPVTFTSFPAGDVYDPAIIIAGKTVSGVKIQCMEGETNKKTTTGSNGEFSFKLDRNIVGPRKVTLSFDKQGFDNRRFTAEFNRQWLMEDFAKHLAGEVQPLSYKNLSENWGKYSGRLVKYSGEALEISGNGSRTFVLLGTRQDKSGIWLDRLVAVIDAEVSFSEGDRVTVYGRVADETYTYPDPVDAGKDSQLPSILMLAYERQ